MISMATSCTTPFFPLPSVGEAGRGREKITLKYLRIAAILLLTLLSLPALALEPDEILTDPVLEQRARDISQQLRCITCENETVDASNASMAKDLRLFIREHLQTGETDEQITSSIVDRYGDSVLYHPPFKAGTWALWLGPVLFIGIGIGAVTIYFRRQKYNNNL